MKKFSYVARDAKGTQSKGMIVANDEKEFMLKLNERGWFALISRKAIQTMQERCINLTQRSLRLTVDSLVRCCHQVLLL